MWTHQEQVSIKRTTLMCLLTRSNHENGPTNPKPLFPKYKILKKQIFNLEKETVSCKTPLSRGRADVKKTQLMFGRPTDKDRRGSGAKATLAGTGGRWKNKRRWWWANSNSWQLVKDTARGSVGSPGVAGDQWPLSTPLFCCWSRK